MKQEKLKLLDLFSGIGGFSLGLESTGFLKLLHLLRKINFVKKF
jgi:site-specific DNA-cytosine methylase